MTEEQYERDMKRLEDRRALMLRLRESKAFDHVRFVGDDMTIFAESGEVAKRRAEMVKLFGADKLLSYYPNNPGDTLAMMYIHDDGQCVVYTEPDVETVLESISGGKCRIEETWVPEKRLVCEAAS